MRTKQCLQELVEFWNSTDRDKIIEYVEENRNWDKSMVDKYLIGWSEGDGSAYSHLALEGYNRKEILSTGAFYTNKSGNIKPLFIDRFIFPYFTTNEDGERQVEYAIARENPNESEIDDFMSGKYCKLAKNKDYSEVDEPIWGEHSISKDTDFALIAEGIADAMKVDNEGLPVLSAVTTEFKERHYSELIDIFVECNKDEVYIIPDIDEPDEHNKFGLGAGLYGSIKTAYNIYDRIKDMDDFNLDVYIAELPLPEGQTETDLDEYLQNHSRSELIKILQESTEAKQLEDYDTVKDSIEAMEETKEGYSASGQESNSNQSAIYSLSIHDVLPADFGKRGANPINHQGSKKNYFVVMDSETVYDHKRKVGYTPASYLLCDAGVRDVDDPNGKLSDEETWKLWKHAKENNIISDDDSVPTNAMKYIARENGLNTPENGLLNDNVYNEVIDIIDSIIPSGRNKIESSESSKMFYQGKSDYYTTPMDEFDFAFSCTQEMSNYKVDEYMWTCDKVDGYIPGLALIALGLGYLELPLDYNWASELTDDEFMDICIVARDNFQFRGEPPTRVLNIVGNIFDIETNEDGYLTVYGKDNAKELFQEMSWDLQEE